MGDEQDRTERPGTAERLRRTLADWMEHNIRSDVAWMLLFFLPIFLIGGLAIRAYDDDRLAEACMMALACIAGGAALGFLFGIPRTLQHDQAPAPTSDGDGNEGDHPPDAGAAPTRRARPGQTVNTNLEQISDWLTKIIVGVSLVQIRDVGAAANQLVGQFAKDLAAATENAEPSLSFAGSLILFFSVVGFLWSYILTRLYLAGAFWRAQQAGELESATARAHEASDRIGAMTQQAQENAEKAQRFSELFNQLNTASVVLIHGTEGDRQRALKAIEDLESDFPTQRQRAILHGRLLRSFGRYREAIAALTRFLAAKGEARDKDYADALYNRACYQCVLASQAPPGAERRALLEGVRRDLEESARLSAQNPLDARTDTDFQLVRGEAWFQELTQADGGQGPQGAPEDGDEPSDEPEGGPGSGGPPGE